MNDHECKPGQNPHPFIGGAKLLLDRTDEYAENMPVDIVEEIDEAEHKEHVVGIRGPGALEIAVGFGWIRLHRIEETVSH